MPASPVDIFASLVKPESPLGDDRLTSQINTLVDAVSQDPTSAGSFATHVVSYILANDEASGYPARQILGRLLDKVPNTIKPVCDSITLSVLSRSTFTRRVGYVVDTCLHNRSQNAAPICKALVKGMHQGLSMASYFELPTAYKLPNQEVEGIYTSLLAQTPRSGIPLAMAIEEIEAVQGRADFLDRILKRMKQMDSWKVNRSAAAKPKV